MSGRTRSLGPTKREFVRHATAVLPKYVRALIEDLLFGTVPIPRDWCSPAEHEVIHVDPDTPLDDAQLATLATLTARVITFVDHVVVTLIADYLARRRAGPEQGRPTRPQTESLRRGRGPAAVRELLFRTEPTWPEQVPRHRAAEIGARLDELVGGNDPAITEQSAVVLLSQCAEIVREYARTRRLDDSERSAVLSEVSQALLGGAARGRMPRNLRAWTLSTAAHRLRDHRRPPRRRDAPTSNQAVLHLCSVPGPEDQTVARLDVQDGMRTAGAALHRRADLLERIGRPADHPDVIAHRTAARILQTGDVLLATAIAERTEHGLLALEQALAAQSGIPMAWPNVQTIIVDALREALQSFAVRESS